MPPGQKFSPDCLNDKDAYADENSEKFQLICNKVPTDTGVPWKKAAVTGLSYQNSALIGLSDVDFIFVQKRPVMFYVHGPNPKDKHIATS